MEIIKEHPLLFTLTISSLAALIIFLLQRSYWLIRFNGLKKELELSKGRVDEKELQINSLSAEQNTLSESRHELALKLNQTRTENNHLKGKLEDQKSELTDLHTMLFAQFENMANGILDRKTEKFSKINEEKIKALIEPLGKEIEVFKQQVTEESKERFSLGEKVKELAVVNSQMNEVALNLTKALRGESKTQGNWGEMILESILEKSGLRKNEQYFMEHQLQDRNGKALRSESEGKKMRPDVLIKYPDERNVIVDSKVSLTAFARAIDTEDDTDYEQEIAIHVASIKTHIQALSIKAYDDYDQSMDFVLMFVPSEPAYIAAMQADPDLWNYAYDRRILLQSPTNLITSLKLIEELWKRESHNQNAQAIAERGGKLYDKFVSFVSNLEEVGTHLDKARQKYDNGFKQLSTGPGNLVRQAGQLKAMVGKTKKDLNFEKLEHV